MSVAASRSVVGWVLLLGMISVDAEADEKSQPRFSVVEKSDRLTIQLGAQSVADFVYRDERIHRPYFAHVRTSGGVQVTRSHPPVEGTDATDHDTMHPGIWLAFGDICGVDFWRNKGHIEHLRFVKLPMAIDDRITFATESILRGEDRRELCRLISHFTLLDRPEGWLLSWQASFRSEDIELVFGDQEEMGFGARVATPLTEKNNGLISSSTGLTSAAKTWGQPADWCDYSGMIGNQRVGITLMSGTSNFRHSWWHNRDYGVFVANPFGRRAMNQGERSEVKVKPGQVFQIRFAACIHDAQDYNAAAAWKSLDLIPVSTAFEKIPAQ